MRSRSRAFLALAFAATTLGGCDLVTPGAPAGALPIVITVQNEGPMPARLEVRGQGSATGGTGIAQPNIVPPFVTAPARFLVPRTRTWAIWVNGFELIDASDLRGRLGVRDDIGITVDSHGQPSWWCTRDCP